MPFGKYHGYDIRDLPDDYLCWLAENVDLREPLRSAVEKEMRARAGSYRDEYAQAPDFKIGGDDRRTACEIIRAGRRALAKTTHPDHGGELAVMQRINVVADALLESLR